MPSESDAVALIGMVAGAVKVAPLIGEVIVTLGSAYRAAVAERLAG